MRLTRLFIDEVGGLTCAVLGQHSPDEVLRNRFWLGHFARSRCSDSCSVTNCVTTGGKLLIRNGYAVPGIAHTQASSIVGDGYLNRCC